MSQEPKIKTWSELGKVLGITVNTLRAWRSEKDSPKGKDFAEWKRFITDRKAGVEGKGSGRIVVDGGFNGATPRKAWRERGSLFVCGSRTAGRQASGVFDLWKSLKGSLEF